MLLITYVSLLLPWVQASSSQRCRLVRSQNLVRSGGNSGSESSAAPQPSSTVSGGGGDTQPEPGTDTNDGDSWKPFQYGKMPIRGVNLGGWFVLEVRGCLKSSFQRAADEPWIAMDNTQFL
jgi:hypothetical protein